MNRTPIEQAEFEERRTDLIHDADLAVRALRRINRRLSVALIAMIPLSIGLGLAVGYFADACPAFPAQQHAQVTSLPACGTTETCE